MESEQTNSFKLAMTYGLYFGLISIVLSVIIWAANLMEYLGLFGSFFLGILQLILMVFLLIYFTKLYRDQELSRIITFREAFVFGVLIVVSSTVISSLYSYIFNKFIDPEYTQRVMTMMQDKTYQFMSGRGIPDDQIEKAMIKFEEKGIPSPIETLITSVKFGLIGGVIMSIISSAIVKKNANDPDVFDEAMVDVKTDE